MVRDVYARHGTAPASVAVTRRAGLAGAFCIVATPPGQVEPPFIACTNRSAIAVTLEQAALGLWPCSRIHYRLAGNASALRLLYTGWFVAGGRERPLSSLLRIRSAIEFPSGRVLPCSFAGVLEVGIPPGGEVTTDPMSSDLAAGGVLCVRTAVSSANGSWPANAGLSGGGSHDGFLLAADAGASLVSIPDAARTVPGYGPSAVLGPVSHQAACAIVGDSGALGAGDRGGDAHQNRGFVARGLDGWAGTISVACSGELAADFAAGAPRRLALLRAAGCDRAVVVYGSNDIAKGHDAEQIKVSLQAVWQALTAAGVGRIVQCTILPKTSPANDGAARPLPGFEARNSPRATVNAWLRTRPTPLQAIADTASVVEVDGLWRTLDERPLTDDGTHPNTLGNAFLAERLGLPALLS